MVAILGTAVPWCPGAGLSTRYRRLLPTIGGGLQGPAPLVSMDSLMLPCHEFRLAAGSGNSTRRHGQLQPVAGRDWIGKSRKFPVFFPAIREYG